MKLAYLILPGDFYMASYGIFSVNKKELQLVTQVESFVNYEPRLHPKMLIEFRFYKASLLSKEGARHQFINHE